MIDFLGNELSVGDTVIFCEPEYRALTKGVIEKITKCYVFIDFQHTVYETRTKVKQRGSQVVKLSSVEPIEPS